jgi:excisionase family DNA binding protein
MSEPAPNTDLVLDGLDRVGDVARFLKLSQSTIYDLMDRGLLPSIKIGKSRRVPHRAVIEFAASNFVTRPAEGLGRQQGRRSGRRQDEPGSA